jgi:hypothetical protein
MEQPRLNPRHRDRDGELARKHGNTLIGTLRLTYGPGFARGVDESEKLIDVLHRLDEPSLRHLIHDCGIAISSTPERRLSQVNLRQSRVRSVRSEPRPKIPAQIPRSLWYFSAAYRKPQANLRRINDRAITNASETAATAMAPKV